MVLVKENSIARFPRIAVNIEKIIRGQLEERAASNRQYQGLASAGQGQQQQVGLARCRTGG